MLGMFRLNFRKNRKPARQRDLWNEWSWMYPIDTGALGVVVMIEEAKTKAVNLQQRPLIPGEHLNLDDKVEGCFYSSEIIRRLSENKMSNECDIINTTRESAWSVRLINTLSGSLGFYTGHSCFDFSIIDFQLRGEHPPQVSLRELSLSKF